MTATGEVSNYLARNPILSCEAGSGERVEQDVSRGSELLFWNDKPAHQVFLGKN